jgi:uncharacterized protein (TIGR00369 family)
MARSAEELAALLAGSPVYELLGMRIVGAANGEARFELDCDRRHANVDGAVHGGVLALLADTAMGFAVRTQLDPSWHNKTLDLSIDYVRGARHGDLLRAVARVEQSSRRFRWASAELLAGAGVVARARSLNLVEAPR